MGVYYHIMSFIIYLTLSSSYHQISNIRFFLFFVYDLKTKPPTHSATLKDNILSHRSHTPFSIGTFVIIFFRNTSRTHTIPFRSLDHLRCCYRFAVPCVIQFHIRSYIFLIIFFFSIRTHTHFFHSLTHSHSIFSFISLTCHSHIPIFFHSHIFFPIFSFHHIFSFSKTCTKFLLHVPLCSVSCSFVFLSPIIYKNFLF